jgi:hypothetical protein
MRSPKWALLLALVLVVSALSAQGGTGTINGEVWVRERANKDHSLLVAVESPDKIDRVQINLPDEFSVVPAPTLPSWMTSVDGKKLTATGEPFFRVNLRFDANRQEDLIRKLTGREINVEVGTPGSTKLVRLKLRIGTMPPVQLQTTLDGALTAPPEFTPGQPTFVTYEPAFSGGIWVPIPLSASAAAADEEARQKIREAARRTEESFRQTSQFFRSLATKPPSPAPAPVLTRLRAFEEPPEMSYFDGYAEELVRAKPHWSAARPAPACSPAITGGTPQVFAGKDACVAGCFPPEPGGLEQAARMLMLDDRPLVPRAASPTTIVVRVEPDTTPGPKTIRWNNLSGGLTGELSIIVLGLEGVIDRDKLMKGDTTTMRLRILGGPQRIPLRIVNRTPSIIQIEGGDEQVVTTSGGVDNAVTREVRGIRKGNFSIDYSLDQPPCGGGR